MASFTLFTRLALEWKEKTAGIEAAVKPTTQMAGKLRGAKQSDVQPHPPFAKCLR